MSSDLFSYVKMLEKRLGVPDNFYSELLHDDDWSFVIKLNALFEAACTHVLAAKFKTPELEDSLAQLDLLHPKYGKVSLLCKLGALTKEQGNCLKNLGELRNKLAHNISNVTFNFADHVSNFDKNQLKTFIQNFGHGINEEISIAGKLVSQKKFVSENPKLAIWLTASEILACLMIEVKMAKLDIPSLTISDLASLTINSDG